MKLTLEQAEELVVRRKDFFWDGWTMVHVRPSKLGIFSPNGLLLNDTWHVAKRYEINDDGQYHVSGKVLGHGT